MNLLDAPADHSATDRDEILAKWKDKPLEEVLKAKVESDLYIKTLERQKDELRDDYLKQREELLAKAKFEELVDRLQNPDTRQVAPPLANDTEKPKYDQKEIESLIANKIEETRTRDRQTTNFNKVQEKLKERYGNNYHTILKDTGLPEKQINEIAMESPEAFFRLIGLDNNPQRESFQTPPRSNQRTDNFAPKTVKRDWNYYQELKKVDPKIYLDPKISVQMHNDAIEQGDAFYG